MLKDRIAILDEEEMKKHEEELKNNPSDSNPDSDFYEEMFVDMITYKFNANGHISTDYKNEMKDTFFEKIVDGSVAGDRVYLLSYHEGYPAAHELGWVVIYDVDALFSKVFKAEESIPAVVGKQLNKSYMDRFLDLLKANDIRYDFDYVNIN